MKTNLTSFAPFGFFAAMVPCCVRFAFASMDGSDEAVGQSFIERHWWDFLVVFFMVSAALAYSDEDRYNQAVFWLVATIGYLIYICLFRNSAAYL